MLCAPSCSHSVWRGENVRSATILTRCGVSNVASRLHTPAYTAKDSYAGSAAGSASAAMQCNYYSNTDSLGKQATTLRRSLRIHIWCIYAKGGICVTFAYGVRLFELAWKIPSYIRWLLVAVQGSGAAHAVLMLQ